MAKILRAGLTVNAGFLFFEVAIQRDNLDQASQGFGISRLKSYSDEDMDLKVFIKKSKSLLLDLEKEE